MRDTVPVSDLNKGQGRNTYKFVSFNERIKDVKVTVSSLKRAQDTPEGGDSFFLSSLLKWREENTTLPFARFSAEVDQLCQSLPILLFNKSRVAQVIVNALMEPESLAWEPLMDLSVQLVKDLGVEVWDEWPSLFQAVATYVNVKDAKVVEANVGSFAPHFHFRVETSFLACVAFQSMLVFLPLKRSPSLFVDYEQTNKFKKSWSSALKSSKKPLGQKRRTLPEKELLFWSRKATVYLEALLNNVYNEEGGGMNGCILRFLIHIFVAISSHITPTAAEDIWDLLISEAQKHLDAAEKSPDDKVWWKVAVVTEVISAVAGNKKGDLVKDHVALLQLVTISAKKLASFDSQLSAMSSVLAATHTLLHVTPVAVALGPAKTLSETVVSLPTFTVAASWVRTASILAPVLFAAVILNPYMERVTLELRSDNSKDVDVALASLADLLGGDWLAKAPSTHLLVGKLRIQSILALEIETQLRRVSEKAGSWKFNDMDWTAEETLTGERVVALCRIVSHVDLPGSSVAALFTEFLHVAVQSLPKGLENSVGNRQQRHFLESVIGIALDALASVLVRSKKWDVIASLWADIVKPLMEKAASNVEVMKGIATIVAGVAESGTNRELFSQESLAEALPLLKRNLSLPSVDIRLHTLQTLRQFQQYPLKLQAGTESDSAELTVGQKAGKRKRVPDDEGDCKRRATTGSSGSSTQAGCELFDLLHTIVSIPSLPQSYREKAIHITKLYLLISSRQVPVFYDEVVPLSVIGMLAEGFAPLWKDAKKLLIAAASVRSRVVWDVLCEYSDIQAKILPGRNIRKSSYSATELASDTWVMRKVKDAENTSRSFLERSDIALRALFVLSLPEPERSLEPWFYYLQLLQAMEDIPNLAEQHSSHIVDSFFEFMERDYFPRGTDKEDSHVPPSTEPTVDDAAALPAPSAKTIRQRLQQYLGLFSKFRHPKKVARASELHEVYLKLLGKGDQKIQELSLSCLAGWNYNFMATYRETLNNIIDDSKFRNQLSLLSWEEINQSITSDSEKNQFMNILLRILYGKLVTRRGKDSARSGLKARRMAILAFLAQCRKGDLTLFLSLMTEGFSGVVAHMYYPVDSLPLLAPEYGFAVNNKAAQDFIVTIPTTRVMGLLHNIEDFIKQLRHLAEPFLPFLGEMLLYILYRAERVVEESRLAAMDIDEASESSHSDHDDAQLEDSPLEQSLVKQARIIRQQVLRRYSEMFSIGLDLPFDSIVSDLFRISLSDKIPRLDTENTQSPNSLLELFATWAFHARSVHFLVDFDPQLLPRLFGLLSAKKVSVKVVMLVLTIIDDLISAQETGSVLSHGGNIIQPCVPHILRNIEVLLAENSNKDTDLEARNVFRRAVDILARLGVFVEDANSASKLTDLLLPSLKRSVKMIDNQTKSKVLAVIRSFVPLMHLGGGVRVEDGQLYGIMSRLLSTTSDKACRLELQGIFQEFAKVDASLATVASIVSDLNAYSQKRLDEMDYDRKFNAFSTIKSSIFSLMDPLQLLPIIHSLLYEVQNVDDYAVRTAAANALISFVRRVVDEKETANPGTNQFMELILYVLFPAIKRGFKNRNMAVRQELLMVLNEMVKTFPSEEMFMDLLPWLADGDEEANIFKNLHHLQIHRRIRALRRIGEYCGKEDMRSNTLSGILVPLILHFVFESDRVAEHELINEAVTTLGLISKYLNWGAYYSLVRMIVTKLGQNDSLAKVLIRLLSTTLDGFHFDVRGATKVQSQGEGESQAVDVENEVHENETDEVEDRILLRENMEESDRSEHIFLVVIGKILPQLHKYLKEEDDQTVSIRVPVALAIAKLLKRLPEDSLKQQLPQLLLSLCGLLRSRLQSARDSTRETLSKILDLLGPDYLSFVIAQLKTSLTRGYQKHVLSYTVSALIAHLAPNVTTGDIDYCLEDIVTILTDDIFGEVAEEKEVKELAAKTKEMNRNKSFETFEMLAKLIRFARVAELLVPLKRIMVETDKAQALAKVDHVLRRISGGLSLNPDVNTSDLLIFIYGLLTESLPLSKVSKTTNKKKTLAEENFIVQLRAKDALGAVSYFSVNAHRFTIFGLTLLLSGIKRQRIDLEIDANRRMLEPLVGIVGECLYSSNNEVVIDALKVLCVLCGAALGNLTEIMPVILRKVFELLATSASGDDDFTQTSLKLIIIVLRERPDVSITDKQLVALMKLIKPELDRSESRSTTFSILRAIMSRKIVSEEIYDIMDSVSQLLVTSQSHETRDLSRSAWLQFLLDYPQGKGRLRKQMNFLVKNLTYEFESGRISVLEMLSAIFQKFPITILEEYSETVFLAVVLVVINDDSRECRRVASELCKKVLQRCFEAPHNAERLLTLAEKWFSPKSELQLRRTAAQVYGMIFESVPSVVGKRTTTLIDSFCDTLESSNWKEQEEDEITKTWDLDYHILNAFAKLVAKSPKMLFAPESERAWILVLDFLLHPHSWIRLVSSRLLSTYCSKVSTDTALFVENGRSSMLQDAPRCIELGNKICIQLKALEIVDDLKSLLVGNITFIGMRLLHLDARSSETSDEDEMSDDEASAPSQTGADRFFTRFLRKLAYIARTERTRTKKQDARFAIFGAFCKLVEVLPPEIVVQQLPTLIASPYRVVTDRTERGADGLKVLAQEVLDTCQKRAGTEAYLDAYNAVHTASQQLRQERKAQQDLDAVARPALAAKRKIAAGLKKKAAKKRKVEEYKKSRLAYQ
ncbi:hypothetical protein M427DRAFT_499228 [Gonapodya prolifera JEL478]|uniref:Uncharacterized protein n=1 Tax=Gonapodya prolifera (strain JEL478) TaxID=1344416 RepID=A0A139AW80_GONPJ|nr:hypothetical protein M427DRAFT_499228 [Gonapodya prolifera JEL478]|eukprot:KXS20992.1 hypothetical protein M427DRAFT_499228 [Gonapodya prolifera JEL478]